LNEGGHVTHSDIGAAPLAADLNPRFVERVLRADARGVPVPCRSDVRAFAVRLGLKEPAAALVFVRAAPPRSALDSAAMFAALTEKERKVAERLLDAMSYGEIARELEISIETVRTHLKHVFKKAGVRNAKGFLALMLGRSAGALTR
jgi:DNA-binding CsgD family transcriptional regulator